MTKQSKLVRIIEALKHCHVLCIGDIMADRFVYGPVSRISPEAPVPVLKSADTKTFLGGAGNVVRNVLSVGASASFVSIVGDDEQADTIMGLLSSLENIRTRMVVEEHRKTTVKTRFIADRQQVLRVDDESDHPISRQSRQEVVQAVAALVPECEAVVISDYAKGFFCREMLQDIIALCRKHEKPVLVDPKGADFTLYHSATVMTPNLKELGEATRRPVQTGDDIVDAAHQLIAQCGIEAVLVTRSRDGMSLIRASGEVTHLKAEGREVFDVSGAGDTVIALMAAACGAGAALEDAAALANVAAGIVVGKIGTAVTDAREMIRAIHHQELSSAEAKVLTMDAAVERIHQWRARGYRIGFTNGIFDLLHPGHLSLLNQAAAHCDRLIVGLNGDESTTAVKGEEPVQHESARSAILASLENVDMVVIFQEETPVELLEALRPDVLVKGANYRHEEVVGAGLVEGYGGTVVLADIAESSPRNAARARVIEGPL